MATFTHTLDWLTCTLDAPVTKAGLWGVALDIFNARNAVPDKPRYGYLWACRTEDDILIQSGTRLDMGTNIMASGTALSRFSERASDAQPRLTALLMNARHVSRLDVAIDVHEATFVDKLVRMVKSGAYRCKAHSFQVIEGDNGGTTLYLGERTSERMLRIYRKSIEMGIEGALWDRVELETHNDAATRLARAIAVYGLFDTTKTWIADFAMFDHPIWKAMLANQQSTYEPSQRKLTDGRKWILETVSKIIADRVNAGDKSLVEELIQAISQQTKSQ